MDNVTLEMREIGKQYASHFSFAVLHVQSNGALTFENAKKAVETIRHYEITDMWYNNEVLYIKTSRPGILIGVKGENINAILHQLQTNCKIKEYPIKSIKLIEDKKPLKYELESVLLYYRIMNN
jgi:ribosomal protein S3